MKNFKTFLISAFLISAFIFTPLLAFGDAISDARQNALDFGTTYKNSASATINSQNKSNTPGYTTDNPEQTKYYNGTSSNTNIDADAQAKIQSSSECDLMSKGLVNRPKITINQNDSFLSTSKAIEGNPDEVVAMLTGSYGECKPLTLTKTENEIRTCDKYVEPNCIDGAKLVSISGGDQTAFSYPYLQVDISRRSATSACTKFYATTTINIKDVSQIETFQLLSARWDDVIQIKLNGNIIFANGDINAGRCERAVDFYTTPNFNLKPYLINGANTLELALGVGGMGNATVKYLLNYPKDRICATIDTCVNIPSNCAFQSSKCLNFSDENICNSTQNIYNCATTTNSTATINCGSNVYCTNNQCTKVEADSNSQDFAKSIAYLQALNQIGADNNPSTDNLKIFTGAANSCSKDFASYNNCCLDSGWGQNIMGSSCKESEVQLAQLQAKKLCHYVGSYCSQKVPLAGTCLKTTKTYCCFNSKISRIIVEQGRNQLGVDWGSPQSPECKGLTADELQKLQFDKMDLSEIASDIAAQATQPNQSYIENKVSKTLEGYGQKTSN